MLQICFISSWYFILLEEATVDILEYIEEQFVSLYDELIGSVCTKGKAVYSDIYALCDDRLVNTLMDQYGSQLSAGIIQVSMSPMIMNADFWFSNGQPSPTLEEYSKAVHTEMTAIRRLIQIGAMEELDIENPNTLKSKLYECYTQPSSCIFVEDGCTSCIINIPFDMVSTQSPYIQQAKILYIAYVGLQLQEYINLHSEQAASSSLGAFIDKASLFQGRFMHLTGVEKFEDPGAKPCVDKYLAANVTDEYFDFER